MLTARLLSPLTAPKHSQEHSLYEGRHIHPLLWCQILNWVSVSDDDDGGGGGGDDDDDDDNGTTR